MILGKLFAIFFVQITGYREKGYYTSEEIYAIIQLSVGQGGVDL